MKENLLVQLFNNLDLFEDGSTDAAAVEDARRKLYDAFESLAEDDRLVSDLEDANELRGFLRGVRFAARLFLEALR